MQKDAMQISIPAIDKVCSEQEIYENLLPQAARVLELGCGNAEKTRAIAGSGKVASILALEVDQIQHAKNKTVTDLPKVRFESGGAEQIPAENSSFDIVFMFKSLHHVPTQSMDQALAEIHRVLAPGGLAYFSEPIFAGDYNEILRLFHDEEKVRAAAFSAIKRAVQSSQMELVKQVFFKVRVRYRDFADFEEKVLKVTHTNHQLSPSLYEEVRSKFVSHMTDKGAEFYAPMRVDLLRKPAVPGRPCGAPTRSSAASVLPEADTTAGRDRADT
jgi:ubiquinone/menaquinone biosynthesis C-methylase UbiE